MPENNLLPALMSAAARFNEAGRELYLDFLPDLRRWETITDLVGAVRLGMWFRLPDGREMVFEVTLRPGEDHRWTAGAAITLDDDLLRLPDVETTDPAAVLDRYVDQLLQPARWHLSQAITG
ncbi:hypothetical protein [Acrocarpospora catenulata]|uniref:hypothetical protein n=1 Tax=Acrocarpospora catenulata TaxID=2836182 RepID=UPI001BDA7A62|nr:hypothetical protein [Acrocarpospora catenulata]